MNATARSLALGLLLLPQLAGCPAARPDEPVLPAGVPVLHVQQLGPDGSLRVDGHVIGVPPSAKVGVDPKGRVALAVPFTEGGGLLRLYTPQLDLVWSASAIGQAGRAELYTALGWGRNGEVWLAARESPAPGKTGPNNWIFRRFGKTGTLEFSRSACFGACEGIPTAVLPAPKAGWIVVGVEKEVSVVARFSSTGWPEWTWLDQGAHLTNAGFDEAANVYAVGGRAGQNGPAWELVKLDREGKLKWTRTYSGRAFIQHPSRAFGLAPMPGGGMIAVGGDTGPTVPPSDDWLVRYYDPDGATVWEASFNAFDDHLNASPDLARLAALDVNGGGVYVLGEAATPPPGVRAEAGQSGPVLKRYDLEGHLVWSRTVAATSALGVADDGSAVVAGVVLTPASSSPTSRP